MTRQLVLGTAGHIDHGKTELIRALTGTDTDRLPEERERGITIDLGFARLDAGPDLELAIIDVPGHEAFVRNMVAGASGIDVVLIVVAADEGVMPQTREHVAIAELLGIGTAVVALTKTDLANAEWLDLVQDDVHSFLATTAFAGAPVIPVSARTGTGIEAVREAILAAAGAARPRPVEDTFRLPVDRVFTVKGTGTVVTGTVWSGSIGADATLRLLPAETSVRVRGLQRHGAAVNRVSAGHRAAVALAGVDRDAVARGHVLVDGDGWAISLMVTAALTALKGTDPVIEQRQRVRLHLATSEVMARVAILEGQRIGPGQSAWVQLRLESPVVTRAGDPFVVRSFSPVTTVAGGTIIEPAPPRRRRLRDDDGAYLATLRDAPPEEALRARLRHAGLLGIPRSRLALEVRSTERDIARALVAIDTVVAGDAVFDGGVVAALGDRLVEAMATYHEREPLRPGMDRQALRRHAPPGADAAAVDAGLDRLLEDGRLEARAGGAVALPGFEIRLSDDQQGLRQALETTYRVAGLAPPASTELPAEIRGHPDHDRIRDLLLADGTLVALGGGLIFHRTALETAAARVAETLGGQGGLGPGDFRDVLDVSRKYLIPILEHLDGIGLTRRSGGGRSVRQATRSS